MLTVCYEHGERDLNASNIQPSLLFHSDAFCLLGAIFSLCVHVDILSIDSNTYCIVYTKKMVNLRLMKRPIHLLLLAMLVSLATAGLKVNVNVEPMNLSQRLNNTMEFKVTCTAKEDSYRYRRYGQDTSRILTRLRILMETSVS